MHHEATVDVSEALAADVGVKNHGLLETESLATPVLNAKNALLERNVHRVKNAFHGKLVNHAKPAKKRRQ